LTKGEISREDSFFMEVIISDDATCFFTTAEILEVVNGQAWAAGIAFCPGITPPYWATRLRQAYLQELVKSPYESNIPQAYRGTDKLYQLKDNLKL
jgi:hypothetical protein